MDRPFFFGLPDALRHRGKIQEGIFLRVRRQLLKTCCTRRRLWSQAVFACCIPATLQADSNPEANSEELSPTKPYGILIDFT
eukprot:2674067-Amphidinium_carterae.1